jgi:hypothetical protein
VNGAVHGACKQADLLPRAVLPLRLCTAASPLVPSQWPAGIHLVRSLPQGARSPLLQMQMQTPAWRGVGRSASAWPCCVAQVCFVLVPFCLAGSLIQTDGRQTKMVQGQSSLLQLRLALRDSDDTFDGGSPGTEISHTALRFTMRAVHVPGHFVGPLLARALYRSLAFSGSTRCTTLVHLKLMHHAHSREIASPKLCL